jgi:hypothetical protein
LWYETDQQKAELFAERLSITFSESNNPNYNDIFKQQINNSINNNRYKNLSNDHQTAPKITLEELQKAIEKLSNKESSDSYDISNKMIKQISQKAITKLLELFNRLLANNIIPSKWKTARINMIPKTKNNKSDPKNYRPISVTPCLMRLYEKIINSRFQNYLDSNKIIIKQQSGFRKERQTKDNLIFLAQKAIESVNKKFKAIAIFFDIQAAFDKVWHHGLIFKLAKIGLPLYLIEWIVEFLNNRLFTIKLNNFETTPRKIMCGVPQGAVMSPILFSVYINDLPIEHKLNSRYSLLFADDLVKLYMFRNTCQAKTIESEINKDLKRLSDWMNQWRLTIATNKSSYLCFKKYNLEKSIYTENDRKRKIEYKNSNISKPYKLKLYVNKQELPYEKIIKFLGIRFDEYCKFDHQIMHIKSVVTDRLNILKTLSHRSWCLNLENLKQLYFSLIRSVIEYSAFLLPILTKKLLSIITVVQNNALRIMLHKKKADKVSINDLHILAQMEPLEDRLHKLRNQYFLKATFQDNPLIVELIEDYFNYSLFSHKHKFDSILDDINVQTLITIIRTKRMVASSNLT